MVRNPHPILAALAVLIPLAPAPALPALASEALPGLEILFLPTLPALVGLLTWWGLERCRFTSTPGWLFPVSLLFYLAGAFPLVPALQEIAGAPLLSRLPLGVSLGVWLYYFDGRLMPFPPANQERGGIGVLLVLLAFIGLWAIFPVRQLAFGWHLLVVLALPLLRHPPHTHSRTTEGDGDPWLPCLGLGLLHLSFATLTVFLGLFLEGEKLANRNATAMALVIAGANAWFAFALGRRLRSWLSMWYSPLALVLMGIGFGILTIMTEGSPVFTASGFIGWGTGMLWFRLSQLGADGRRAVSMIYVGQSTAPLLGWCGWFLWGEGELRIVFGGMAIAVSLFLLLRLGPAGRYFSREGTDRPDL